MHHLASGMLFDGPQNTGEPPYTLYTANMAPEVYTLIYTEFT
jgi:hypothetical protein